MRLLITQRNWHNLGRMLSQVSSRKFGDKMIWVFLVAAFLLLITSNYMYKKEQKRIYIVFGVLAVVLLIFFMAFFVLYNMQGA